MPTGDASLDGMGINYIGGKETYSGDDGIDFGRDRGSIKPVTPRTPGVELHNPTMPTISPIARITMRIFSDVSNSQVRMRNLLTCVVQWW